MNCNIYVDKVTGDKLSALAKELRLPRNRLIRRALEQLLARPSNGNWPESVRKHLSSAATSAAYPRFEAHRKALREPQHDPFGRISKRPISKKKSRSK
jgi:predicted transcriptional regulator